MVLVAIVGTTPDKVPAGTPIRSVRIERLEVFDLDDPATSARPYRWVDALHVLTRERFIRSLLLFEVGDPLDPLRLAESELILRGTGFLNPVTIEAHRAADGAEVVVTTRDQWTTSVDLSYDVSGNVKRAGGSLSDDNLLGTGKSLLIGVESDAERSTKRIGYKDRAFRGGRWQERTYLWALTDLGGRIEGGGVANAITHFELGGAMTGSAGLRLRVVADLGKRLDGDRQLTLGADEGLRGYDPSRFDGTSRLVGNLEWRHRITGELLHIAVLSAEGDRSCLARHFRGARPKPSGERGRTLEGHLRQSGSSSVSAATLVSTGRSRS